MLAVGDEIAAMPLLDPRSPLPARNHGRSKRPMIVVDSSALIAILEKEPDAATYAAVNVHGSGMVLRAPHGKVAADRMWRFLKDEDDFEIVPFDEKIGARGPGSPLIATIRDSIRRCA